MKGMIRLTNKSITEEEKLLVLETYEEFDIMHREHEVLMENASFYNETEELYATKESVELEFAKNATVMFMNQDRVLEDADIALLNNIAFRYIDVMESLGIPLFEASDVKKGKADELKKKAKDKTEDVKKEVDKKVKEGKKAIFKGREKIKKKKDEYEPKVKSGIKKVKEAIKQLPSAFKSLVDNTYGRLKRMNRAERKKAMLEGGMYRKLSSLIRNGLRIGTSIALGPVLGSIFFIGSIVHSAHTSDRIKNEIVADMKQELAITKEKIRDADSNGDKEAKYQLMRIKDQLERDINKVTFNLNQYRATSSKDVN